MKKTPNRPADGEQQPEEMIDDLESLKELLVEEDMDSRAAADSKVAGKTSDSAMASATDDDVPLLDDTVDQVLSEDLGMPDETFNALLGDAWQDSVDDLFNKARRL